MHPPTFRLMTCGVMALLVSWSSARADVFDHYVNLVLDKLAQGKHVREVKQLTPAMIVDHDNVLPRIRSAFLVVRTNGNRWAKLLVGVARQKVGDRVVPILSVERFVTYKEGEERTVLASGKDLSLYPGFRLSLDLGQVVPEEVGGDLHFVAAADKVYAEPLGKAKLYLVVKHDPGVEPKKSAKFVMGEKWLTRYFAGTYQLEDDGRRSGKLILDVEGAGREVKGWYYSDRDGRKYEVQGRIGEPRHAIEFTIKFPRTEQVFKGMLFTGNGRAIAGTSTMAGRQAAFYCVRLE